MSVTVYSKNQCMQCKMTKRFLTENHINFTEHNVSQEPEYVDVIKSKGFMKLPVVETENEIFAGFRPDKLNQLKSLNAVE